MLRRLPRFALGSLVGLVVATIASAAAASNTVPPSRAGESAHPATLADFVPPQCAGMALNGLQIGPGGGGGNALILGTPAGGTLSGGGGNDCIVGGANNYSLQGQGGSDVLIGGPVFLLFLNGGGGNDVCYRGSALIVIPSGCETYYP
jgi:Ca2+-binding RTX toxin-like protein